MYTCTIEGATRAHLLVVVSFPISEEQDTRRTILLIKINNETNMMFTAGKTLINMVTLNP